MALVNYSDSESDKESDKTKRNSNSTGPSPLKRKHDQSFPSDPSSSDLPPLPAAFHDLYASTSRVSTHDDPSLHGGRKRVTPHIDGNWATHVYLEWYPTPTESSRLSNLISALEDGSASGPDAQTVKSLLTSDLGAQLPLHISLSRPIVLVTEQREPFADLFREQVRTSGVRPFDLTFTNLHWVSNYESTRWFLVLRLSKPPTDALNRLLRLSNQAVASFGQGTLYAEPIYDPEAPARGRGRGFRGGRTGRDFRAGRGERVAKPVIPDCSSHFHVSVAWTLEAPSPALLERTRSPEVIRVQEKEMQGLMVSFESVKLKIGNGVTVVPLPTKVSEGKGLIGL